MDVFPGGREEFFPSPGILNCNCCCYGEPRKAGAIRPFPFLMNNVAMSCQEAGSKLFSTFRDTFRKFSPRKQVNGCVGWQFSLLDWAGGG